MKDSQKYFKIHVSESKTAESRCSGSGFGTFGIRYILLSMQLFATRVFLDHGNNSKL